MILVLGSQGQLGQSLRQLIGEAPEHVFLTRASEDFCGDITDTAGITETLMSLRPEIIINAAAYTAVDKAETDQEAANLSNAKAPGVIAQIAAKLGSLLVHYSTDYVFDGSGNTAWRETDACKPLSVYGKTKLIGEQGIVAAGGRHLIIRASWLYSPQGANFLTTMLKLAQTREEIKVVCDQWGVPTHVDLLASTTLDLINLATPGFGSLNQDPIPSGIYHCAPQGETSWFDYASLVINTAKTHGYCKACKTITPITSAQYPTAAQRPLNSRLNTEKLNSILGKTSEPWEEDVVLAVGQSLLFQEENDEL